METNNWLVSLSELFEEYNSNQIEELLESDVYKNFKELVCLPPEHTFILSKVCSCAPRSKGLKAFDIIGYCSKYFEANKIQSAYDELLLSGWIFSYCQDSGRKEERLTLRPEVETALRTNDPMRFPAYKANNQAEAIRILSTRAAALRRTFITKDEWMKICDEYITSENLSSVFEQYELSGEYVELRYVVCFIIGLNIYDNCEVQVDSVYSVFCNDQINKFFWSQKYLSESSPLKKYNLIEFQKIHGFDYSFSCSLACIKIFIPNYEAHFANENPQKMVKRIQHSSIPEKLLFYDKQVSIQASVLEKLLNIGKFQEYQNAMLKNSEKAGITILVSGEPGTGKTEFAKQLARKTNRDILVFEVSGARSKWYGETEKNIKNVFEEYHRICEHSKHKPILLFNEADSLFNTRQTVKTTVGQVENVIQTILLNELENFEGVLIATTNRADSFDKAFSRRFHFQIDMHPPEAQTRTMLLKDYFPTLTNNFCNKLAKNYFFTGADLLNIKKKISIYDLINQEYKMIDLIEAELNDNLTNKTKRNPQIGYSFLNQNP